MGLSKRSAGSLAAMWHHPSRWSPAPASGFNAYFFRNIAMPLNPDELAQISALTLAHYQSSAEDFREGTRDHDVSQNIAALLRHIEDEKPWRILDFGCGPGRDLRTFSGLGHTAIGLDGCAE